MSHISSVAKAPPAAVGRPVQPRDADGDHDGTRAPAAATAKPEAASLATSGTVGRNVNTVA